MTDDTALLGFVSDLEGQRAALLVSKDMAGLAGQLSEQLYYAHSTGLVDDKSSFLDKVQRGVFDFRSVRPRVRSAVRLGEDAVQAAGLLDLQVRVEGIDRRVRAVYLAVWRREGSAWRLTGFQAAGAPADTTEDQA
ncbi:nuclear transport factor 2 family protein [Catenulispora sp. NF23]|uniref:Nuclear transport factor 2 family protein n=1 Tax=Catenulispora pinistramenti TaxID=2705254 RepID=A0ABS5KQH9_9ACTN|nr:nuclear transport factor 2 family protein [Catenulispora pinistramenti]MBS2531742.1 nuclear transport factor 2 family protein [Catenulispora pinistramenti]MBS2548307.1 nuclear transport factor 2 family protein [Catenulispora pinistramenti]